MDQQQLADSPAFSFLHGQLSMVLAGCQQLPCGWQQQEEFQSLLQQALDMLQQPSSAAAPADAECSADTSNDKCSSWQKQPAADQDKCRQQPQQQKQQPYIALDIHDTDTGEYAAAAAAVAEDVAVLGSSSSSELLQAFRSLAAAVQEEYAEVLEAETPVRSAICAAGGLNHLLLLITAADSSCSTATPCTTTSSSSSGSSMEVAIAAGSLLLALTESGGSHRYCNLWAHHYIAASALPALVRLLLFHDALAKRAAELLASLARDGNRHTEIAAAGGIAGLLHVLAGNGGGPLAGKAPAAGQPYAVLAAAAAAVEALIEDGPLDVQVAVAEAGGVAVLEGICEHLVRQKMATRQRLGPAKQHAECRSALTVEIPA